MSCVLGIKRGSLITMYVCVYHIECRYGEMCIVCNTITYIGRYMRISKAKKRKKGSMLVCRKIHRCRLKVTKASAVNKMVEASDGGFGVISDKPFAINHVVGRHGFVPFVNGV